MPLWAKLKLEYTYLSSKIHLSHSLSFSSVLSFLPDGALSSDLQQPIASVSHPYMLCFRAGALGPLDLSETLYTEALPRHDTMVLSPGEPGRPTDKAGAGPRLLEHEF